MKLSILLASFCFAASAVAASTSTSFSTQDISIKTINHARGTFADVRVAGFENSRTVGAPQLPVKSVLVVGHPSDIQVQVKVTQSERLQGITPYPVQPQKCRCANDRNIQFAYNQRAYNKNGRGYRVSYLGAFRGTPVSRIDVDLAMYDTRSNSVVFYKNVEINHSAPAYSFDSQPKEYKDYLILVPETLSNGVTEFAEWKHTQGYNVIVESLKKSDITLANVAAVIKKHYQNDGTDFVIIVGDDETVPMYQLSTSGGTTPSDLKYFTMDDAKDHIPDMFYSRVAASTEKEVSQRLQKAIEFDKHAAKNLNGLKHVVGIASNEGSSPSDNEYIQSIETKLEETFGFTKTHFYQNDSKSNPKELNNSISDGASWLFYVGHGSGTSWPSMYDSYSTSDVAKLLNFESVKPVIIDVACQNGRVAPGYLGTTFAGISNDKAFGSAAYYGGTVNISWDPPAIMARGIAYEHAQKNFRHLGEALLAGQLYLAANWNSDDEVVDNFTWYHLQGDPGMLIAQ